jgi:excisionase family DNA binding protein
MPSDSDAVRAPPKGLLSTIQAAERLTVSDRLVRGLIARGLIRSIQIGRCRRIPVAEIERIEREGV